MSLALTFVEPSEVDEFEVGLWLQFEESKNETVDETDLLVALEGQGQVIVLEAVLERNDFVDAQSLHRPSSDDPLDRLRFSKEDGLRQQQRIDVRRQKL